MSIPSGTIVVGVDGSESSTRALGWAVEQAKADRRSLTLVHAVHGVTPSFTDAAVVDPVAARNALESQGRAVLAEARSAVEWKAPDLEVYDVLEVADPREALLQLSENAAMTVVGSRGHGRVRRLLLGSVSVALVRHAHCPVVVVRPTHVGTVRHGVVVGLDASEESRPVLEFAYREAALRDLPLTVVHCVWDIAPGSAGAYLAADVVTDLESERVQLSEAMAGMGEKYPEVSASVRLATGVPERVLLDQAERTDLIVVGGHQRSPVRRALSGSVSLSVVEHAVCPVAVVPLAPAGVTP